MNKKLFDNEFIALDTLTVGFKIMKERIHHKFFSEPFPL